MENQPILRVINVHKSYRMGRNNSLDVLKGIDMEVREGEIIAVVGPSGVGKSTLLHIIGILDRPSKGHVEIDRQNVFSYDDAKLAQIRNQTAGFVFQAHHLLPEFSALENVMMPSLIGGKSKSELQKRATALLEEVGLEQRIDHRPKEMSGGEQQRVAVARALINSPRLLLADEPSGNLDMKTAQALHALLWHLSREHKQTLIIVTHNHDLAKRADRIIELYDGRIKRSLRNSK
ncbi:ABC transporter ATP-binding protein [candidate division KSB1 bacterium]|nr:ABC transporter ATP-binding protein [candidate division KSB1 bacterium]RQW00647.1 MAG: ABC transporter ATP-binding protein [candidate division KSB1 bacterium]